MKARDVTTLAMPTATRVSTTSEISVAFSTCVRPAVASAWSSAITSDQSVPGMWRALISLGSPSRLTVMGSAPSRAMAVSAAAVNAGATSVDGFNASLSFTCEMTWPSAATTNARLDGVGRMARMMLWMPSSGTAPLSTPVVCPPRIIGAVKAT
ncbi:hypothetical protein D3C87_1399820 [compost metagenome]